MSNVSVFTKSVSKLSLTNIFFTALLYNLKWQEKPDLPASAGTDGVYLYYNPEWFEKFDVTEGRFTLAHEIMHVVLMHSTRRGSRDPEIWNIACDHAVNLLLKEHDFQPYPTDPCDSKYTGMTAEQIYDQLIKSGMKPGRSKQGAGPRSGDVKEYKPSEHGNISKAEVERNIGINLEKALQAAKMAGQLTEKQRRELREAQVDKEPWFAHFRRYMTVLNSREYCWSRIDSRRAAFAGIVSPAMRVESMGKMVWSIDESGSLTDSQLAAIGAHGSDICRECHPKEVVIIRHTDEVTHVETYYGPMYDIKLERKSSGGTDFRPVFDLIAAEHSDAQVVAMFTDMYGPMPDDFAGDVVWITSTKDMTPPFGTLIGADFNDD